MVRFRGFAAGLAMALSFGVGMCDAQQIPQVSHPEAAKQTVVRDEKIRIRETVNDNDVVRVTNSKHTMAVPPNDRGRVAGDQRMDRMMLVLKPSARQDAALQNLIDAQHDSGSKHYIAGRGGATRWIRGLRGG